MSRFSLLVGAVILFVFVVGADLDGQEKKGDLELLQGSFMVISSVENGNKSNKEEVPTEVIISGKKITFAFGKKGPKREVPFEIKPEKKPKEIDFLEPSSSAPGIYSLERDALKICFSTKKTRPTDFVSKVGDHRVLIVLKRVK